MGTPILMTQDGLRAILPRAPQAVIDAFIAKQDLLTQAGINATHNRLAYFWANVEHESGGFAIPGLVEDIHYSPERMAEVWPKRFPGGARQVKSKYGVGAGWNVLAIDDIYGDRMGNRPGTHDGSTYIGRGGPQWTGREGYEALQRLTGIPAVDQPEQVSRFDLQPEVCVAFWMWKDLNRFADAGNFEGCVKAWNGGTTGMADRLHLLEGNNPALERLENVKAISPVVAGVPQAVSVSKWPADNQEDRNAFYGDPAKGEIAAQLVPVIPPFKMTYTDEHGTKAVTKIMFHRKAAPALLAALNEIWDACGHDQGKIDALGLSKFNGAYNHRYVRGSTTKWSNHAYGTAIDLNADQNAMYAQGNMPQIAIDAFCRQGFMWGGWYKNRKDAMHFEAVNNGGRVPLNPAPAKAVSVGKNDAAAAGTGGAVIAVGTVAAVNGGVSVLEIIAWIGGASLAIIVAVLLVYRYRKGHWPWMSVSIGDQSPGPLLPSLPNLGQSLDQASARLAELSAGSPATSSPLPSGRKPRLKRSGAQSRKTPTRRKSSSGRKRTTGTKSSRKRK